VVEIFFVCTEKFRGVLGFFFQKGGLPPNPVLSVKERWLSKKSKKFNHFFKLKINFN